MSITPDLGALARLTAELIRIPSPSGREGALAAFVRDWLTARGVQAWTDRAGNLLAFSPGREAGPGWMLLTHLDHVSVGDEALWSHPPFAGVIEASPLGPIVHGRGAVDIKGPLAAHATLLVGLKATPPRRGVLLVAAAGEETTGAGAAALVENWPPVGPGAEKIPIGAVIVGEPSSNQVMLGHRGVLRVNVKLHGRAHHASFARLGENPFFSLAILLDRIAARDPLQDVVLGADSISPTLIAVDSTSSNVTPNTVTLTLDWRTITSDSSRLSQELAALLDGLPATGVAPDAWTETSDGIHSPGFVAAPGDPLVALLTRYVADTTGAPQAPGVWRFATDGRFTARIGVPTVGFGPGDATFAHTTEERVLAEELALNVRVLDALVAREAPPSPP